MKRILVAMVLSAFVAAGSTAAFAKNMNAEHMSRARVKATVKHQKAEAERQKARQTPVKADKRSW